MLHQSSRTAAAAVRPTRARAAAAAAAPSPPPTPRPLRRQRAAPPLPPPRSAAAAAASVPFPSGGDDGAGTSTSTSTSTSSGGGGAEKERAGATTPPPPADASAGARGRDLGGGVYAGLRPPAVGLALLAARLRALLFAAWTFTLAVPLFAAMALMTPLVLLADRSRRLALHFVNNLWAVASTAPFFRVTVEGLENLPPNASPAVYVANHASFMDIFALFHLARAFKFVSKTSNFLIPVVGWSMFLTGHVGLERLDRRSQLKCLGRCVELLGSGASILFFPEGTRSKDGRTHGFKKGAFSVAARAGVPVVPVTLLGTAGVMPNGREGEMYGGRVRIVVHPPVPPQRDAGAMAEAARRAVASALPADLVAAAGEGGEAGGG